ncbi:hypothetical protein Hanom_Chr06g00519281 [Helianthus anomalus]
MRSNQSLTRLSCDKITLMGPTSELLPLFFPKTWKPASSDSSTNFKNHVCISFCKLIPNS